MSNVEKRDKDIPGQDKDTPGQNKDMYTWSKREKLFHSSFEDCGTCLNTWIIAVQKKTIELSMTILKKRMYFHEFFLHVDHTML